MTDDIFTKEDLEENVNIEESKEAYKIKNKNMKKFWFITAAVVCTLFAAISCDNAMSRKFGGSTTINLPAGQKLIEVTLCQKVLKVCKSV